MHLGGHQVRTRPGVKRMPMEQLLTLGAPTPITRWGNPVLHRPCAPVTEFGPDPWDPLCTMFATNAAAGGASRIRAPLSPWHAPDFAICRGQDQFGAPGTVSGTGNPARCLQHETDHLNGIVIADRLTPEQRRERTHERAAHGCPVDWPAVASTANGD